MTTPSRTHMRLALAVGAAASMLAPALLPQLATAHADSYELTPDGPAVVLVGDINVVASGKSYRSAPQNGANNLLVIPYSCGVAVRPGYLNATIESCEITTDLGDYYNDPGAGGVLTDSSAGTVRLTGNSATLCVVASATVANVPEVTSKTCRLLT